MSDYLGRIKLTLQGLAQINALDDALASIEQRAINVQQAIGRIGPALQKNAERRRQALRGTLGADLEGVSALQSITRTAQRRGVSGRFLQGPNVNARRLARQRAQAAKIDAQNAQAELRLAFQEQKIITQLGKRLQASKQRIAGAAVSNTSARSELLDAATSRAGSANQQLRLSSIESQFQRRLAAFSRGGGGKNAPELIEQVFGLTQAWAAQKKIISATGDTSVRVTKKQAAELGTLSAALGRYNEAQLEANRLANSALERSVTARSLGDRLRPFEIASGRAIDPKTGQSLFPNVTNPGFDTRAITRARTEVNRAVKAADSGDQELFRIASFQAKRRIEKLEAGLKAGLRGAPSSLIPQGPLEIASRARALRESGGVLALPSRNELAARVARSGQAAPARLDEQQAAAQKRLAEEAKHAAGRLGRFGAAVEKESRRREKLGIGAVERVGGPARRTGAIPMGGGSDSGIVPRALPNAQLLQQRVALSQQQQPTRLDTLKAEADRLQAEEAKRAAGSVGRFAAAAEREARRLESLGIGQPARTGSRRRGQGGAIPMGGTDGMPFNQLPFPAGPGNERGIARFREIQLRRQRGRLFQGNAREAISSGLIGGGFPLLFGQGVGGAVGGGLGGVAGGFLGGGFGFGVSVVGTAVGAAVDQLTTNLKALAESLKSPTDGLAALEQSGFRVSESLKFQVQQLESTGRAYDAQTLVLAEVERRLGAGSVRELNALASEQRKLEEQWSQLSGSVQGKLIPALTGAISAVNFFVEALSSIPEPPAWLRTILSREAVVQAVGALPTGPVGGNVAAKIFNDLDIRGRSIADGPAGDRQPLTPQEAFASETTRIQESRKQADQIQSAYREAFKLQRQAYDLQRDGADINRDIADYVYNKQREIFNLQQQAAEQQITNFRDSAQNRIEGQDLDLREAFAGATGFEQQLLSAARESMRVRKEGEADIEAGRRRLELAMARIQKDSDDYSRTTAREIEDIERRKLAYVRSVEDFKMQVADYQLARAREAADLMRQAMSMTDMGSASGMAPYVAASLTQRIPFMPEIDRAAREANVDPRLLAGLVKQESGFNPNARSRSGAIGLAQLMPGTARELGVDPLNIQDNLRGGARYLRQMIDQFGLEGGLRAYNQGPGAQRRTPAGNSRESREYPGLVLANARGFGFNPVAAASASATGGMGGGAFGRTGQMSLRPGYGMVDLRGGTRQTIIADAMDAIVNRAAMNMRTWIGGDGITDVEATNLRGDALRRAVEDGIRRHETRRNSPATAIDLIAKEGEPLGIPVGGIRDMGGNAGVGGTTARGTLAIHLPLSSIGQGAMSMEAMTATQMQSVPIPQMRDVSLMDTPSAAPLNAERLAVAARLAGGLQEAQKLLEDQAKLRERGVELSQLEAILQSNQVPELQDQYSVLQKQLEVRRQNIGLVDEETAAADLRAESEVRLARIETDRRNALAKIGEQVTDPAELAEAQDKINRLSQAAADIAKNEEEQKRKNLQVSQQLENSERVRAAIQQASQELATEQAIAAALLRGETEATAVELLKAQDFYQKATDAEKQILESKIAQTDELRKQNQINQQTNQLLKDARFTGAGLRSGLIGPAAAGFEDALRAGGTQAQALERAAAAQALQDQQLIWDNLAKDITAVSDAISGALTQGLADIVTGARNIKEVGKEVLDSVARSFLDSAQQQLSVVFQRQIAGALGGEGGVLTSLFGAGTGAATASGPSALGAAAISAAPPVTSLGVAALGASAALQALTASAGVGAVGSIFSAGAPNILGGLLGGASPITSAFSGGLGGPAFSAAAPNLLGSFFGGASPLPLNFLPGLAGGGDAEAGQAYMVGEVGPELFIPGVSGRVVKNSDIQKAARLQEKDGGEQKQRLDVRYEATEIAGEKYVTEGQFRKGMARAAKQGQSMAYSGMRNSNAVRQQVGI